MVLLCLGSLTGCFYQYAFFNPSDDQLPIVLFGRYQATLRGWAEGDHELFCEFSFIHEVRDTTKLDSLPVLILDSICLHGACLGTDFCLKPSSWYDMDRESMRKGNGHYRSFYRLILGRDIYYYNGQVTPGGFDLVNAYRLPENCNKNDVTVELWIRMLNRETGKEMARESKIIQFQIKRGSRLGMS
jgi:hypothetical protein